jgi:hypothetical protein
MPSRGYTTPDQLPYPNNPAEAADVPPENRALADAVQLALNNKIGVARRIIAGDGLIASPAENLAQDMTLAVRVAAPLRIVGDIVGIDTTYGFSPVAHGHPEYALAGHTHGYANASHTHPYSQVGLTIGDIDFGTINAGTEKTRDVAITQGDYVFVTVQHSSTYIYATADHKDPSTVRINCRNGTSGTNHTNVHVVYLIVRV